jgi:hypothetical protein
VRLDTVKDIRFREVKEEAEKIVALISGNYSADFDNSRIYVYIEDMKDYLYLRMTGKCE